jgi:hypothetical protein
MVKNRFFKFFALDTGKDLYEERGILLSRIGQHEAALAIYAYKIGDFQMAEK